MARSVATISILCSLTVACGRSDRNIDSVEQTTVASRVEDTIDVENNTAVEKNTIYSSWNLIGQAMLTDLDGGRFVRFRRAPWEALPSSTLPIAIGQRRFDSTPSLEIWVRNDGVVELMPLDSAEGVLPLQIVLGRADTLRASALFQRIATIPTASWLRRYPSDPRWKAFGGCPIYSLIVWRSHQQLIAQEASFDSVGPPELNDLTDMIEAILQSAAWPDSVDVERLLRNRGPGRCADG